MGYRSDLKWVMCFERPSDAAIYHTEFCRRPDDMSDDTWKIAEWILPNIRIRDKFLYFEGENLKWYEGFSDVDFVEQFFRREPQGFRYAKKIRIGESEGDIEVVDLGDCWDAYEVLELSVSIDFNLPALIPEDTPDE